MRNVGRISEYFVIQGLAPGIKESMHATEIRMSFATSFVSMASRREFYRAL